MKTTIQFYCVIYAGLGTIGAAVWFISCLMGHAKLPENVWTVEAIFVLHGTAAVLTFHRTPIRPAWKPLLPTSAGWLRSAKLILCCVLVNFILCLGTVIEKGIVSDVGGVDRTVPLILTSFVLLNTIYILLHWLFRPENLFSEGFINALANPVGWVSSGRGR